MATVTPAVTILTNTSGVMTQKGLTVTGFTANNKQYDGTKTATINTANAALAGVIGSDMVTLINSGTTGAFVTKNAGSNIEVDVSGFALGGAQVSDYSLNPPTTTASITRAPLTIVALTNTKSYDGNTAAPATPTVSALIGSDTVAGLAEVYSDKNAGTGKALSVSACTINDGNGGNNYAVTTVINTTGAITKTVFILQATTNTKSWDGTASAAAVPTVTGLATGDSISGLAESYSDTIVGTGKTLTVNPGYTVNDGNGGKNYTVTTASANTGVITPPASILTLPASMTVIEPPQGMTPTIYLSLTVNLPLNYTVTYKTVSGTAVAGTDFVSINPGTVHVLNTSSGTYSVQIPITIRGGANQQPGGLAVKSFAVQLVSAVNNGSGNAFSQSLLGAANSMTTINLQQVKAPTISIGNQSSASSGVFVNITTYWPTNPPFTAAQYAQAGGDVYLNYSTSLNGKLFSSATIHIPSADLIGSGTFQIPNFKIPARPPTGLLTVALVAITTNAAIDPLANVGIVGYS